MDVKTESKIILTVLALAPAGAGIVLVVSGEAVPYGWILIILGLGFIIWLWKPWKWFGKQEDKR